MYVYSTITHTLGRYSMYPTKKKKETRTYRGIYVSFPRNKLRTWQFRETQQVQCYNIVYDVYKCVIGILQFFVFHFFSPPNSVISTCIPREARLLVITRIHVFTIFLCVYNRKPHTCPEGLSRVVVETGKETVRVSKSVAATTTVF